MKKSLSIFGLLLIIILSFSHVNLFADLNVPGTHCASTQAIYTVDPIANTHHYVWSVFDPTFSGWSPSSSTTSSTVTWVNLTAGTSSATVTVTSKNALDQTIQLIRKSVIPTTIPATPTVINLPAYHCSGSSMTYTVNPVACATGYNWGTTGAGWSITSTANNYAVVVAGASSGTISVRASNSYGNSAYYNAVSTPMTFPGLPGAVTQPATHCAQTSRVYYIAPVPTATSYTWTAYGTNWAVTGSSSTVSIYAGAASGTITVAANNVCGTGPARTFTINPLAAPNLPVPPITEPPIHCEGTSATYSIAPVVGATSYTWVVSGLGWSASSSTTTVVSLTAGSAPATISVYANYTCGQSLPVNLLKTPVRHANISGAIAGPTKHCINTPATYSVTPAPDANYYTWTVYGAGWSGSSTMSSINITAGPSSGTITAQAHNVCGPGNIVTRVISPLGILAPPTNIAGPSYHCFGSSATYSIVPVAGADTYTWSVTGPGWIGVSNGTNYALVSGPNSGTITVTANNYCGASTKTVKVVSPLYIPVTPEIDAPMYHCANTSNTYSVTPDPTVTHYIWTVTGAGWTHGDSTKSWFVATASTSSATITCTAVNQCGSGQREILYMTPTRIPAKPTQIYKPTRHCVNTAVPYQVAAVSGATSYTWRITGTGWSGSSNTANCTITAGTGEAIITVTANTACGSSDTVMTRITSSRAPAQPDPIEAPTVHCQSTIKTYSINDVNEATSYSWTITNKPGTTQMPWVFTTPTGGTSVELIAGAESATLTVIANNQCGPSIPRRLVLVPDKAPVQPTTVQVPTQHCAGTIKTYRVTPVSGALTYTWTVTGAGWSGNNSSSDTLNVTSGTVQGTITVRANNLCGSSPVKTITVSPNNVPNAPTGITLPAQHCETTTKYYKVIPVAGAQSYTWSVAGTGWSIAQASTRDSIAIIAGTGTANIACSAVNACGTGSAVSTVATSLPIPSSALSVSLDTIKQNETVIVTYRGSAPDNANYNWSFGGGTAVPGTGKGPHVVTWSTTGLKTISLVVTQAGCISQQSLYSVVVKQGVGVDDMDDSGVKVAVVPNPNDGTFMLNLENMPNTDVTMQIVNSIGQTLMSSSLRAEAGMISKEINLDNVSSGVYYLKIRLNDREIVKQIMIVK